MDFTKRSSCSSLGRADLPQSGQAQRAHLLTSCELRCAFRSKHVVCVQCFDRTGCCNRVSASGQRKVRLTAVWTRSSSCWSGKQRERNHARDASNARTCSSTALFVARTFVAICAAERMRTSWTTSKTLLCTTALHTSWLTGKRRRPCCAEMMQTSSTCRTLYLNVMWSHVGAGTRVSTSTPFHVTCNATGHRWNGAGGRRSRAYMRSWTLVSHMRRSISSLVSRTVPCARRLLVGIGTSAW
mmetsp:Transcript_20503/g.63734  ORF Transcript_20503/g.63734 Transcript_20503/m.63734 type:complete len:242 (-) Transcript_20503:475-1200(-)